MSKPLAITRGGVAISVLVLIVSATCVRLGFWQLERREQRRERNRALVERTRLPSLTGAQLSADTSGLIYRRVTVQGTFDHDRSIALAARALRGLPGVHLFTPLRLDNQRQALLVNRGWVPAADGATIDFDSVRTAPAARLTAVILPFPEARAAAPDTGTGFRRTWFQFDQAAIRAQLPYDVLPYQLQAQPDSPAVQAFPIRLRPPEPDEGPHLGYAIQWFSFAAIGFGGWLALVLRRTERQSKRRE